jgi:hypothetical protein
MSRPAILIKKVCCLRPSQFRNVHADAGPSFRNIVARLGYMTNNGISLESAPAIAQIMRTLSTDWRELVAGVDGFLTNFERRGTSGKDVEWGHLVSIFLF